MGPAIDLYLSENDRLVPRLDLCMKGSKYVNDAGLVVEVSHNGLTSFISLVLCMTDRKDTFAIIADKTDHTRVQQCKICSKRPRPLLDLSDFSYEQDTQTLRLRLWVTEMCLHVDPKKMGGAPSIHFYFSVSVCLPPPLFPLSHRTSALSDGTPGMELISGRVAAKLHDFRPFSCRGPGERDTQQEENDRRRGYARDRSSSARSDLPLTVSSAQEDFNCNRKQVRSPEKARDAGEDN